MCSAYCGDWHPGAAQADVISGSDTLPRGFGHADETSNSGAYNSIWEKPLVQVLCSDSKAEGESQIRGLLTCVFPESRMKGASSSGHSQGLTLSGWWFTFFLLGTEALCL